MGSRRKRRMMATVHMDQLNFKGVSGLTIDEEDDKPKQRWMAKGACIGDVVSVQTGRKGKASLIEVLEPSSHRIDPNCQHFLTCGGCQLQHTPLELQREHKEHMIRRLFADFTGTVHPIVGAEGYHYRNKMELSFGPDDSILTHKRLLLRQMVLTSDCTLGNGILRLYLFPNVLWHIPV